MTARQLEEERELHRRLDAMAAKCGERTANEGSDHVRVPAMTKCPACGVAHEEGLPVMGSENHIENHDTYKATARGKCCGKVLGVIRVTVSTIFGLEEDEAVLNGRWRVY